LRAGSVAFYPPATSPPLASPSGDGRRVARLSLLRRCGRATELPRNQKVDLKTRLSLGGFVSLSISKLTNPPAVIIVIIEIVG